MRFFMTGEIFIPVAFPLWFSAAPSFLYVTVSRSIADLANF